MRGVCGVLVYTHDNRSNDRGSSREILDMVRIEIQQTSIYEGGGFGYMAVLGMEMQQSSTIINCLSFASQGFCGPTLNHWPTYAAPRQH